MGAVTGTASGILHPLKKPAAVLAIGTAALGALAYLASSTRKSRRFDPNKISDMPQLDPEIPPVLDFGAPQQPMIGAPTMMGMQPITNGPMVQRFRPNMAQAVENPTVNPEMMAVPSEHIQSLNEKAKDTAAEPIFGSRA
ncbi:MAG: hypothetical protein KGJ06_07595 [Pseudomonadota bacterium]|nr:hypothetical protein [Pseudomonadota bacterium]